MASTLLFQATKLRKTKTTRSGKSISYTVVKKKGFRVAELTGSKVKEAACHQMETISCTTSTYYNGLKKTWKECSKDVGRFSRSFSDFVDVEDVLKSIHKARYPDKYEAKKTSIVHEPIDWSKYPPSAYRKRSQVRSSFMPDEEEESQLEALMNQMEGQSEQSYQEYSKVDRMKTDKWSTDIEGSCTSKEDEESVKKKSIKKSKQKKDKYIWSPTSVKRSHTFSHRPPSTIEDQKVFFTPPWSGRKSRTEKVPVAKDSQKYQNYCTTINSHEPVYVVKSEDSNDESVFCSKHFDRNPRSNVGRSQSFNYKKMNRSVLNTHPDSRTTTYPQPSLERRKTFSNDLTTFTNKYKLDTKQSKRPLSVCIDQRKKPTSPCRHQEKRPVSAYISKRERSSSALSNQRNRPTSTYLSQSKNLTLIDNGNPPASLCMERGNDSALTSTGKSERPSSSYMDIINLHL